MEEEGFNLKRFLFGSIRKKLGWAFGLMIMLMIIMIYLSYSLNNQISQDAFYVRNVNAPLEMMVEQVIGYDAMLTGTTHAALLHLQQGDLNGVKEHKQVYDNTGVKLDDLLKFKAKELLNKSRRTETEKQKVYNYLDELNTINLALVELEIGAFDAIEKGDNEKAYSLVVSPDYQDYKKQLADLYQKWSNEEKRIAEYYEQRVLDNSLKVKIYNLFLGILFLLVFTVIPIIINSYISQPIAELTKSTRELEKGNLKTRVIVKTGDEIEELGKAFNKTAEQLEKIDEERKGIDKAKTEFLSITSHELRSPMTPMQAQLQMLMQDYFGKLNDKQRESLNIVLRNTQRLDKIIQDFLEISRIEAARLKFNFIKIGLSSYIKSVIEEMKGFMPEKKIKIELVSDKLPIMEVDPDRVMQVLRNLLNNAIKFSRDYGKIEVKIEAKKDFLLFSVKDNGLGIKKEEQIRIFEPFFQSGGMYSRKFGGTGLGLAICKGIVESQKGKIWFESAEEKGTIFYFTLPYAPVREMAPIKLLFSPKQGIENQIRVIMTDFFGPLGEREFEDLRLKGLTEKEILSYINEIHKKGVVTKERSEEFKSKIKFIFEGKKEDKTEYFDNSKKFGLEDLKKEGLIK